MKATHTAAAEYRREDKSSWCRDDVAPDPVVDLAFADATRRECAIEIGYLMLSTLHSELLALERGDDALASCHYEANLLLARDKAAATRPLYARAFPSEGGRE
jgi:hypothetical protein